ncbi:MAG: IS1634 family transposase, partial [Planctomycetota bacterium]|nr:IS1634 family transposase [Planctomycetota bacterium]
MFPRVKRTGRYEYFHIVESYREGGRVRQRIVCNLGRLDILKASGALDALLASMGRFSERLAVLGAVKKAEPSSVKVRRIGAPMVFGRLWRESGVWRAISDALRGRKFGFSVERAVFLTVLHRLIAPGSDRAAERWKEGYRIEGASGLELHHLYRAMAWLGGELSGRERGGGASFAPRCVKDAVEEGLFEGRRDLFSGLELVFFDTTSLYFEGEGGEEMGRRGNSKDHRPDLKQMVVGVVMDESGRPICTEMWPGNTADVKALVPVARRLSERFGISNVCVVADRGMVSGETIRELEAGGWKYILGARMRGSVEVREEVLGRGGRYREVVGAGGRESPLKVKDVMVEGRRYVVCLNEEEAAKDREMRAGIVEGLREALRRGG